MMDIGVASPSAHGHAMMRTDTAATTARPSTGAGAHVSQATNARAAAAMTAGTSTSSHRVCDSLDGCAAALRVGDYVNNTRQHGIRTDFLGVHHQRTGAIDSTSDGLCSIHRSAVGS